MRRSYWEDVLYNQHYDLIVIGAGITGQSSAYFYKKKHPDARVLIVDRGTFPIGASTRNAGFACFGSVTELQADLKIETETRLRERINQRYQGLHLLREELGDEYIEYEETGGWEIFTSKDEFNRSIKKIPQFNSWMEKTIGEKHVFSAAQVNGYPAIYNRCEGMLHPGKMMRRLHQKNIEQGSEYRWDTHIKEIDTKAGFILSESDIEFKAGKLIIATNAFTTDLLNNKVKPARGYVFVSSELNNLPWKGTFHYNKGFVYFRNIGKDRLLLGGARHIDESEEQISEFGINKKIKSYLKDFADEVLKLPEDWAIDREWSGIMGFTESKSPIIESLSEHCLLAAGLSGMGVAIGMQLGKTAAERV